MRSDTVAALCATRLRYPEPARSVGWRQGPVMHCSLLSVCADSAACALTRTSAPGERGRRALTLLPLKHLVAVNLNLFRGLNTDPDPVPFNSEDPDSDRFADLDGFPESTSQNQQVGLPCRIGPPMPLAGIRIASRGVVARHSGASPRRPERSPSLRQHRSASRARPTESHTSASLSFTPARTAVEWKAGRPRRAHVDSAASARPRPNQ